MLDLLIIGAGPAGISAAFEARKLNLNYLVLEKNLIGNTIYQYPIGLTVFSTVNELELQPNTLFPAREKPTREELLSYYTRFVLENALNVQWEEEVKLTEKIGENHFVTTTAKGVYQSQKVLFAFGAMQYPRHLGVKGEDLPKVHHLFRETYPYVKKHALVVGGGNSAGEAALFLAQEGAFATLATFRKDWEETDPKQGCIKHWVKEPLEQQLQKNCLDVFFLNRVVEIKEKEIVLEEENGEIITLPNDVVFILIGSDADLTMLERLGVRMKTSKYGTVPVYDEETFETNVAGVYVAGHFTEARHIAVAIEMPKIIIPKLAAAMQRNISDEKIFSSIGTHLTESSQVVGNATRDRSRICVVEKSSDLLNFERTQNYRGLYHILHGSLSPARGIGPDQLQLANLLPRLMPENNEGVEVKEIIIVVNPTIESRATANYISRLLKPLGISVNEVEIETADIVEVKTIQ